MPHKDPEKRKEYTKKRYQENKEVINEKRRAYVASNKDKVAAMYHSHYLRNQEKIKTYRRQYYKLNKEQEDTRNKAYSEANKEQISTKKKATYRENLEENREKGRLGYAKKSEVYKINAFLRTRRSREATPKWGIEETKSLVKKLKRKAEKLKAETGVIYHIDHVIPLKGSRILDKEFMQLACGLHVYTNLQLLTAEENHAKWCLSWPDMWEYSKEDLVELKCLYEDM
jgi:hypothetical protein